MDDEDLLERFLTRFEGDTTAFDYFDLLHRDGSPFWALFYSRLFFPVFVKIDDMILLPEVVDTDEAIERLKKALAASNGDRTSVEKSFNRTDIELMFGKRVGDTDDEEDCELARRIAAAWRMCLQRDFPDRQMVVILETPKESGGTFGLTFYTAGRGETGKTVGNRSQR
jgi:hypothetical protein